jgi:hypothetical protein
MSARFLVLAFLVAAPSAFAAGHWQGEHAPVEDDLSTVRVNSPIITRPGTGAADAVRYLAGVTTPVVVASGPVAPSAIAVSTTPPGPPPEDVSIQFRREVTAVLTNGEPHIVLAGGRRIGRGEVYQDGWRLRDVSAQRAVLAKGRETRSIDLFSAPPLQPVQIASAEPVITGPVSFSNGLLPDQRANQAARIPVQSQQIELLQQLRDRMAQRQQGGRGGNNNNRGRQGGAGGPNGGFGGGGFGGGGFGGGRRNQQEAAGRTVVITPSPPSAGASGN